MSGNNSDRDGKKIVGRFFGETPHEIQAAGKTNGGNVSNSTASALSKPTVRVSNPTKADSK